jgi:hypothetical protein
VGRTGRRVAVALIGDPERICARKKAANKELNELLAVTGTTPDHLTGCGPSGAATLPVEVGDITRFPDREACGLTIYQEGSNLVVGSKPLLEFVLTLKGTKKSPGDRPRVHWPFGVSVDGALSAAAQLRSEPTRSSAAARPEPRRPCRTRRHRLFLGLTSVVCPELRGGSVRRDQPGYRGEAAHAS